MIARTDQWSQFRTAFVAAVKAIGKRYVLVARAGACPVRRERVYCYELYHQLRSNLAEDFEFVLHAEIDKRGHSPIARCFEQGMPNPDFVVHIPGQMDNLVVVEVKRSACQHSYVQKDIDKLEQFVDCLGYKHGILLMFGEDRKRRPNVVSNKVSVLMHEEANARPRVIIGQQEWDGIL